jgi:hypothetical protein
MLGKLLKNKRAWPFEEPVDPKALKLGDYKKIVKKPMDLGTVRNKLEEEKYNEIETSGEEFYSDVVLTFDNALRYNPEGDEIWEHAYGLKRSFQELWANALARAGHADRGNGESAGQGGGDRQSSESEGQTSLLEKHVQLCKNPLSMLPFDMLDQVPA